MRFLRVLANGRTRLDQPMTIDAERHNDAEWLLVRFVPAHPDKRVRRREGWYVVRICPCHWHERVTIAFETEAAARRVRAILMGDSA